MSARLIGISKFQCRPVLGLIDARSPRRGDPSVAIQLYLPRFGDAICIVVCVRVQQNTFSFG